MAAQRTGDAPFLLRADKKGAGKRLDGSRWGT
jgi:hypothetical protein